MKRPTHTPLKQMQHLHAVLPSLMRRAELCEAVESVMTCMEQAYDEIASHCGFICRGCEESCCRTLFYHHTYAEFMFLEVGLKSLRKQDLEQVLERAVAVQTGLDEVLGGSAVGPPRAMCPLNQSGRCLLYAHRPMICRLHGIPHTFKRPDGQEVAGPGCHRFDALSAEAASAETPSSVAFNFGAVDDAESSRRLDRTPHYQRLAQVEQQLRSRIDAPIRLNMTLAEWLAARTCCEGDETQSAAYAPTPKDLSP
jgi:Fe-S-cluster containining protein